MLRHLEITASTFNRWRAQYGGMKADETKRLKTLESENQRLKKLGRGAGTGHRHAQGVGRGKLLTRNVGAALSLGCNNSVSGFHSVVRAASQASIAQRSASPYLSRPADERLAARLREIAGEHPRWGWKDRSPDPAQGGLDDQSQADTPSPARGGSPPAREDTEAASTARGGLKQRLRASKANEA